MNIIKIITIMSVTTALSGCFLSATKMYEGKELDNNQISRIKGMDPSDPLIPNGWSSFVTEVDSKPVTGNQSYVHVLPGTHNFKLKCSRPGTPVFVNEYEIETIAGGWYDITVNAKQQKCGMLLHK